MTGIDLGRVGVALAYGDWAELRTHAPELERLGYSTLWIAGGQLTDLDRVGDVVRATSVVPVATAIVPVVVHDHDAVAAVYHEIQQERAGRFVVGVGGAHGPRPLRTMADYLDGLDAGGVPRETRMLSALGARMLELARDRAAGALSLLVTPDHTARARGVLGADATLAVHQYVVLGTDAARARETARAPVRFLTGVPGYVEGLRRMGFDDEDISGPTDRLVDAVVAWGDADAVAARVREHQDAGADHVALVVLDGGTRGTDPLAPHRRLASVLGHG